MHYNVTIFGVKDTTRTIVEYILEHLGKVDLIVTISDDVLDKTDIAGYDNIDILAKKYGITVFKTDEYSLTNKESKYFFEKNTFDIGISLGWQRLIPESILETFMYGVYGFHGSCAYLPFGRGRSPLNWSLVLGDKRFILNMFKYDKAADSPNVFSNRMWEITDFDTIRTMQYKNLLCSKEQIKELLTAYRNGHIPIKTVSKDFDSWYEKRTAEDGRINFGWRTWCIYNLIRAVTHPFPGAFCYSDEHKVLIWNAVPFDMILDFSGYKPGEVVDVFDGNIIVRTIDGSLMIREYEANSPLQRGSILY